MSISIASMRPDEGKRVGQKPRHVEQLERDADLEADTIRAAEQFDDEDDLPHKRQTGPHRRREIGHKLRHDNMSCFRAK